MTTKEGCDIPDTLEAIISSLFFSGERNFRLLTILHHETGIACSEACPYQLLLFWFIPYFSESGILKGRGMTNPRNQLLSSGIRFQPKNHLVIGNIGKGTGFLRVIFIPVFRSQPDNAVGRILSGLNYNFSHLIRFHAHGNHHVRWQGCRIQSDIFILVSHIPEFQITDRIVFRYPEISFQVGDHPLSGLNYTQCLQRPAVHVWHCR